MNQETIQSIFYVCYAKEDEPLAKAVMDEINNTLETNYNLWSYGMVGDSVVFFEEVVQPAIDKADFVLFMLTDSIEKDEMARKAYFYCHDLNKSMIPLKVGKGRLRLRSFVFRTEIVDFDDRQGKVNFLEQMHSWLGLTKVYEWSEVKFCSNCGKKINTLSTFCKWCGTHFDEQAQKRCAKCGNPLKPDVLFCNRCGNKIL